MHIAVEGCSHGELDIIYKSIERLENIHKFKIDLLLCCGDFQSVRNENDLKCMAVPIKYLQMQDFHKYYSGKKKAPILTIFIGGNHEASNYLQELPYGGWVAPNIYYLGYAGVIQVGGLRIGGLSGIYKAPDYLKGHYEKSPYTSSTSRSVYHVRNLEVFRLKQLSNKMDIFMSHDWPRGIYYHGNFQKLIKVKQHFEEEIKSNKLGSRPAEDLIKKLKPTYWFSGHLHVKFSALLMHEENGKGKGNCTKFLALDKCLPRREFLQILKLPTTASGPLTLSHDAEWLTILRLTNHLLSTRCKPVYMPGPGSSERYNFTPTPEEIEETLSKMGGDLTIPVSNFVQTAECFNEDKGLPDMLLVTMPEPQINPQTTNLCSKLDLDDPILKISSPSFSSSTSDFDGVGLIGPQNKSEINVTMDSEQTGSSFDASCNPEEIKLSDGDEFEICKDGDSGDFIMEVSFGNSLNNSLGVNMSPIRKDEKLPTPIRESSFSPLSSSPRIPEEETSPVRKAFSLSKPKDESLIASPLSLMGDDPRRARTPSPLPGQDDSTASESSPATSISFLPLSSSQSEEESDTSAKSLSLKRESSCEGSGGDGKSPFRQGEVAKSSGKPKKFKRRNESIYSGECDS